MADIATSNPDLAAAMSPFYSSPASAGYMPGASSQTNNPMTPQPMDPSLLLSMVGASSPSRDGTASTSVGAATDDTPSAGDQLRSKALDTMQDARDASLQAMAQPVPQMQRPQYTPLETAIGLALGGALNAASPFTNEGTHALNALMLTRQQAAQNQFQSEVQQHNAAIDAARQGYQIASDQARGLFDQADTDDQQARADTRSRAEQAFQENLSRENEQARIHEEELASMHRDLANKDTSDATEKLQQQRILQQKLVDVLSQTGPGRAMLAAQAGVALRCPPGQIVQLARIAAQSSPATVAKSMKAHLAGTAERKIGPLPPAQP